MKYTLIAVTAFVFATSSCHRNLSITLDEVPTERIRGVQCLRIDSCSIANIFLYGDYVVGIVPQSNWEEMASYITDGSISASANYQAYQNDTSPIFYGMAKSYGRSIYALYHGTRFLQPYSEIQVWQDRGRLVKRYVMDKWVKCFDIDVSSKVLCGIYVDDEEYIFSASLSYI